MAQNGETATDHAPHHDEDEELLRAALTAREGDLHAFEQLIHRHRKRILADCQHLTRDPNNAEDLAQEVFVKAFFGLRSFEGRSTFRHWLQRIKVNHCLNHLKKQEGNEILAVDDEYSDGLQQLHVPPVAEQELVNMEERRRIHHILSEMPITLRIPLVMREMDELSYEEIAAIMGIGLSAVKMRIKRAREHFARLYHGREQMAEGPT
jgi:RNA polymerase sigma-70 factor (ECF subfamily)